jgi:hypothetical protein
LTEVGAEDHLERLAHRYTGHGYYGPIYPQRNDPESGGCSSASIPAAATTTPSTDRRA